MSEVDATRAIVLATRSQDKLRELRPIFQAAGIEVMDLDAAGLPEEAGARGRLPPPLQAECHPCIHVTTGPFPEYPVRPEVASPKPECRIRRNPNRRARAAIAFAPADSRTRAGFRDPKRKSSRR